MAQKDTFFTARRYSLIGMYLFSIIYPFIIFPQNVIKDLPVQNTFTYYMEGIQVSQINELLENTSIWNSTNILLYLYVIITLTLLTRSLFQLLSIAWLKKTCNIKYGNEYNLCLLEKEIAPFSFFKNIFINPNLYTEYEYTEIITHEKTHVKQLHSMDLLLSEIISCFFWYNPFVWLFKKEVRDNLEFLADYNVIKSGFKKKDYQYHLLRTSYPSAAAQLINTFNVPPLKKRITMMNKKRTNRMAMAKYALLLPVTLCLISFTEIKENVNLNNLTSFIKSESEIVIKGNIKDENNKALPGVAIIIKGSNTGTLSEQNGDFSITAKELPMTLVFSYVGKSSVEQYINEVKAINVRMENQPMTLNNIQLKRPDHTEEEIFVVVEDMPKFIGGDEGLKQYLSSRIIYPETVAKQKVEGQVIVGFTINEEGKPINSKIIKSIHPELDKEALRVINNMPNWIPGKQRGIPVNVDIQLPIEFLISK